MTSSRIDSGSKSIRAPTDSSGASRGDWEAVNQVAREVRSPVIAGLARCNREDIDKAWSAVREAARPRLHVFLATSAIHREHKLNMAKEQIIHTAVEGVKYARSLCADIEFSPEDASRTDLEFLREVVEAVIEAGATTINVPDTVGYTVPEEFHEVFDYLKKNVKGADRVTFSVHCHNDLGMAVANSLAAVRAGARQVECTINGIGERAGNASLEELVMAIRTREGLFGLHTLGTTGSLRLLAIVGLVDCVLGWRWFRDSTRRDSDRASWTGRLGSLWPARGWSASGVPVAPFRATMLGGGWLTASALTGRDS